MATKRTMSLFEATTKEWLQLAEDTLGNDKETYSMLLILFRDYTKQRLDFEGLVNAVGELVAQHASLIKGLLQLPETCKHPLSDASNLVLDLRSVQRTSSRHSAALSFDGSDTTDSFYENPRFFGRRTSQKNYAEPNHEYEDEDLVQMSEPRFQQGRPSAKENRGGTLTDQEHVNLFAIVQSLERHPDNYMIYMKVGQPKSKNPTPIPLFSSIRTKARRKRYKCLQDFIDHCGLLWNHLGPQSERMQKHFFDLVNHYFCVETGRGKRRSSSPPASPQDDESSRPHCT
ncbi:hypothetical protein EDD86DRAFT_211049 [Gorgonomyces haynaldii]|nr:hypothetical protein EDD86DRAFT_211049 [Gorgonomyces haynaldii]